MRKAFYKAVVYLISFQIIGVIPDSLRAKELSGRSIMEKNKVQQNSKDEEVTITMTLINKRGEKRIRKVRRIIKTDDKDLKKTLIIFESPPDVKGTKLLTIEYANKDDDQWFYLPALKRVRRIAATENDDSFMGSEVFFEDIRSEKLDDYQYTLLGTETFDAIELGTKVLDGTEYYVIEAVPKTKKKKEESTYSKRKLWICKDNFLTIRTEFYDRKGKLLKIFHSSDIRLVSKTDKLRFHKVDMHNVQINHKTELLFEDYKINQGIPNYFFTHQYLYRE